MANLNQVAFPDAIKTAYEKRLLLRALDRLVHGKWGTKARLSKNGSYELRKYGGLGAVTTPLIEGTTPTEQNAPSLDKITVTPLFYGAWIGYTDEMEMTVMDPIISETTGILGEQAGLSVDQLHRAVMIAGATTDYSGGAAAITDLEYPTHEFSFMDLLVQYAELLAANAMPMEADGCYPVIIHPYTYITLFNDPIFVNLFTEDQPDSKGIRYGYVGRLMNMKFYVTAQAYVQTDAGANSADVYSALILGKESYGSVSMAGLEPSAIDSGDDKVSNATGGRKSPVNIIAKPIGSSGTDDPLDQRGTLAWKTSFVSTVLNANWIRNCKHVNMFS